MVVLNRRRLPTEPEPEVPSSKLDQFRRRLEIDRDDLDECFVEQVSLFDNVASAYEEAISRRDEAALILEEEEALEDRNQRQVAARREEKTTDTAIKKLVALQPRVKSLNRELLRAKAEVGQWKALKEAYEQRSYMLKELGHSLLGRMGSGSMGGVRGELAERARTLAGEERTRRRFGGG